MDPLMSPGLAPRYSGAQRRSSSAHCAPRPPTGRLVLWLGCDRGTAPHAHLRDKLDGYERLALEHPSAPLRRPEETPRAPHPRHQPLASGVRVLTTTAE